MQILVLAMAGCARFSKYWREARIEHLVPTSKTTEFVPAMHLRQYGARPVYGAMYWPTNLCFNATVRWERDVLVFFVLIIVRDFLYSHTCQLCRWRIYMKVGLIPPLISANAMIGRWLFSFIFISIMLWQPGDSYYQPDSIRFFIAIRRYVYVDADR